MRAPLISKSELFCAVPRGYLVYEKHTEAQSERHPRPPDTPGRRTTRAPTS
jgi:hypothetical protein